MLRRILPVVLFAFFLIAYSIGCNKSDQSSSDGAKGVAAVITSSKPLNVGFIPYDDIVGRNGSGQVSGFMVDVLNAALSARGYDSSKVVYHETTWDAFWIGLDSGKYDLCIAGTFRTSQRAQKVDFLDPLFSLGNGAVVRADDARFKSLASINDLDQKGLTVAVVLGEYGHEYATKNFKNVKIQALPGPDLTLAPMEVLLKRADAAMSDQYVLRKFTNVHPETVDALADHPYNVLPICWSVRKGNAVDVSYWNAALRDVSAAGKLDDIMKKYSRDIPFIRP